MSTLAISLEQTSINMIRTLAMDAVEAASSGHPGTPVACGLSGIRFRQAQRRKIAGSVFVAAQSSFRWGKPSGVAIPAGLVPVAK